MGSLATIKLKLEGEAKVESEKSFGARTEKSYK
jgi:hypothetical protein